MGVFAVLGSRSRKGSAAIAMWLVSATLAASAVAQTLPAGVTHVTDVEGIVEYRCANGLQVLFVHDDSKPSTTVNLTVRVGSRFENYGETGMAHLLEHMLFKGTPTHRNPGEEFTRRGLRYNGSTTFDRTNYFASFAANDDNLRWYLDWLADALVHSNVARKDLDSEMTVVRNEMESGENNAGRILFERMQSAAYEWHNYGKSTIGARTDVEQVDIARLQAFYRLYYQPDNATLIVSGRFDPQRTLALVAHSFGTIPKPKGARPTLYTLDPTQDGERAVTLRRVGGVPFVAALYHSVPGAHPDFAAFSLLGLVLGDQPSGRLHRALVQTGLASEVFGFARAMHDPGIAMFGAVAPPTADLDRLRDTLARTIESFATDPVTDEEFKRAQAAWLKNWELGFSDPERVGVALSESIAIGDWRMFFLQRDRVRALTRDDVQRVATQYLVRDNRTMGVYIPTDAPVRAPAPAMVDVARQLAEFKPDTRSASVEAFDATPASIERRVVRSTLPNGMKLALLAKGTRGALVHATLALHLGDETSLMNREMIASLTADMLERGTTQLSRAQIRDRLDALKARVSIEGGAPTVSVDIETTREHFGDVLALVAQMLRSPAFPASEFDELRREEISSLEANRKEPAAIVGIALARHGNPYPRGHLLYAQTIDESLEDLQRATLDDLRAFHRDFYGAGAAEFAAVGDFDATQIAAQLNALFGEWRATTPYRRIAVPWVRVPPATLSFDTPDKANAVFVAQQSWPVSEQDDDYVPLAVANYILGGAGDGSRLWNRIREKEGLSYGVSASVGWSWFDRNATWQSEAIFAPQNRDKLLKAWREEIDRAVRDGVTADELARAKSGLLRARQLARAQDGALAGGLATLLHEGRTFDAAQRTDDAIRTLTLDRVNTALRTYLKPDDAVIGLGGDFAKGAGADAKGAGAGAKAKTP